MSKARTEDSFDPGTESPSLTQLAGVQVQNLKPYGIGIDTHKRFIQVTVLTHSIPGGGGEILRVEREFPTDWPSLIEARQWAQARVERYQPLPDPSKLAYTIESTGTYHIPVIRAWQGVPSVVNPLLASPSRRKTDVLDARLLAQQAMMGMWPVSFIASDHVTTLRVILNERNDARREALRARNRIENILLRYGHTIHAQGASDTPQVEGLVELLLEVDEITPEMTKKLLGLAPMPLPPEARIVLRRTYTHGQQHTLRAKETTKLALAFVAAHHWPGPTPLAGERLLDLLRTVPGVGPVTALLWIAHVADPARFVSAKQVAAYCGCDPTLKVSAGKVTSYTRRGGNKEMRRVLLQAAAVCLRKADDPLGAWGRSIMGRTKRGGWKKACGAVARRISVGLYHVHRTATPFDPSKWQLQTAVDVPSVTIVEMLGAPYAKVLQALGYEDSTDVVRAFYDGLAKTKGVGTGCLERIKEWVKANRRNPSREPSASPSRAPSSVAEEQPTIATTAPVPSSSPTASKRKGSKRTSATGTRRRSSTSAKPSRSRSV
ncbi:MAG: IS110 family transposase [Verrucomicrobia bacterium]|nr:IS110 family transposase [Verrucomicrobiota bacterium]